MEKKCKESPAVGATPGGIRGEARLERNRPSAHATRNNLAEALRRVNEGSHPRVRLVPTQDGSGTCMFSTLPASHIARNAPIDVT